MPHIELPADMPGITAGFAFRPETAKPMRELAHLNGGDQDIVAAVCADYKTAPVSAKLKALLAIAEQVQIDGKRVTAELVQRARAQGATDLDIHDTVLIAAAFSMYNRYVDGLATWQPRDPALYAQMGQRMAEEGYSAPAQS